MLIWDMRANQYSETRESSSSSSFIIYAYIILDFLEPNLHSFLTIYLSYPSISCILINFISFCFILENSHLIDKLLHLIAIRSNVSHNIIEESVIDNSTFFGGKKMFLAVVLFEKENALTIAFSSMTISG
ncbi:hypothetical protein Droror1_Dr00006336 [Drosera rotundifolia]